MLLRFFRRLSVSPVPATEAELCFYVLTAGLLSLDEYARLVWLLSETFEPEKFSESSFLQGMPTVLEVGPRLNFETAYSTTARTICSACGITNVARLEQSFRYGLGRRLSGREGDQFLAPLHDRMTQMRYPRLLEENDFQVTLAPKMLEIIDVLSSNWKQNLVAFSKMHGLGWDDQDLEFLRWLCQEIQNRDPTGDELFQLGQANSDHSRHWKFKGIWIIDGVRKPHSLMDLIKRPLARSNANSVIAFADDSSAIRGNRVQLLIPQDPTGPSSYEFVERLIHPTLNAETHNHPEKIEPYQGAMTEIGGVTRDEHTVGRGGRIGVLGKGMALGNLHIPGFEMPWENDGWLPPSNIATPLQIALRGSDGAFDYGNAFGQPVTFGFFRTFGQVMPGGDYRAFYKPVGYGVAAGFIDDAHTKMAEPKPGMLVMLVGGPAYRIGVGGGSGSSMLGGENSEGLDFASVQRGDPEMEARLDRFQRGCVEMGDRNPIQIDHDLGAGGIGNAVPEAVYPAGARVILEDIPSGDPSLSSLEISNCEAQERDVIITEAQDRATVEAIARRENVPLAVIGEVTGDGRYVVESRATGTKPVDLPLVEVLGNLPPKTFYDNRVVPTLNPLALPEGMTFMEMLGRVLRLPAVASKAWLIHKVDRSVTGLVAQQQAVGPYYLPLSDFAIRADGHLGLTGTAYSLGERPNVGLLSPGAMVRLAVTEALLNIVGARITHRGDIKGSTNWMLAAKLPGQGAWLYDAMEALVEFMESLGVASDGGKDSTSMATPGIAPWGESRMVASPGQFVYAIQAKMTDITRKVTPVITEPGTSLLLLDLGLGKNRLGGSALAQVLGQIGNQSPDMEDPELLCRTFDEIQRLLNYGHLVAAHDRSDGGLITTLLEMSFASGLGMDLGFGHDSDLQSVCELLFNEEPGMVLACERHHEADIVRLFRGEGLPVTRIGNAVTGRDITVSCGSKEVLRQDRIELRAQWEEFSYQMERLQRDPECAETERNRVFVNVEPPPYRILFTPPEFPYIKAGKPPRVAIVRDEGSNGEREMALFKCAGFDAVDVTMTDLISGAITLDDFRGAAFVGGFSYRDVFDAGKGWAGVIRFNPRVRDQFEAFRNRQDTFGLGVCNGAQLMPLIGWVPGLDLTPELVPRFVRNRSGKFESRFSTVRIVESPAIMLAEMEGSVLGVWVSHGEGQWHGSPEVLARIQQQNLAPIRYADRDGNITETYPDNPNGSRLGIAAMCSPDGRFLAMMPHLERTMHPWNWPWIPESWTKLRSSPWFQMLVNARLWCD